MKKKTIKNIISKTILFIGIIIFILLFKTLFGEENVPVGVTVLIALFMLLSKDLTRNPIKNFMKLLGIHLSIALGTYIASNNLWLGIIIDFTILSVIGYYFSYNMTKGLILPYGLMYLFTLSAPVQGENLIKRWLAFIFGAVIIMISQFIVNAKKNDSFKKESTLISFNGRKSDSAYRTYKIFGKDVKIHTIRASYAIRIGLLTAITSFLVQYFNLAEGRWMVYTIFSLTELYSENTKVRAKKRIQGTIIGALILLVFFYFVKNTSVRGILILVAGYLNSFAVDYRDLMILTTISAITPLALSNGAGYAVFERLFYVIVGIILALLANRFVLMKSKEDYVGDS